VLKVLLLPAFVGLGTTLIGLTGEPRLALVMMAGMPCAFAGLILAEEYDLDHDLAASSIALSTVGLLVMIPIWLGLLS
jgi:malate permease and related proteins